ncbi:MAG: DUF3667 domain-containing protein [Saprospiraceae bacterium]
MSQTKDKASHRHRYCPNCHYPLAKFGEYCSNCGQKYTNGKVPIWVFLHDLTEAIFNIDSKVFTTLFDLFKPGKLTIQFFKGRQKRYATPMRLFLIMAIFHFATLSWYGNDTKINFIGNDGEDQQKDAYYELFLNNYDSSKQEILRQFSQETAVQIAFDSLDHKLEAIETDSFTVPYLLWIPNLGELTTNELEIPKVELYTKTPTQILDDHQINGFVPRIQIQQIIRIIKDGRSFSVFLLGKLIWMVALMMPALAFTLKLLYIRRKRYFVEHLVFSFHYHAFAFLIFGVLFLALKVSTDQLFGLTVSEDFSLAMAFMVTMIYLFIAMKRVYNQGFFKTFIKYTILNFSYLFIFTLFLVLTLAVSALIF